MYRGSGANSLFDHAIKQGTSKNQAVQGVNRGLVDQIRTDIQAHSRKEAFPSNQGMWTLEGKVGSTVSLFSEELELPQDFT